jgi:hypothetical protein
MVAVVQGIVEPLAQAVLYPTCLGLCPIVRGGNPINNERDGNGDEDPEDEMPRLPDLGSNILVRRW